MASSKVRGLRSLRALVKVNIQYKVSPDISSLLHCDTCKLSPISSDWLKFRLYGSLFKCNEMSSRKLQIPLKMEAGNRRVLIRSIKNLSVSFKTTEEAERNDKKHPAEEFLRLTHFLPHRTSFSPSIIIFNFYYNKTYQAIGRNQSHMLKMWDKS